MLGAGLPSENSKRNGQRTRVDVHLPLNDLDRTMISASCLFLRISTYVLCLERDPVAPFKNASTKYRDPDTEQLQTQKFNALLRKIEEVDVQMQYAGQFSADTKLPPLTLQSMRMSHSNKIALGECMQG